MNAKKTLLMGTALAGLMLATEAPVQAKEKTESVMCYGVNSCKGHGQCGGKVDACSGKSGCEAKMSCGGRNSCKGKGLIKMSKKDCLAKKGKIATDTMM